MSGPDPMSGAEFRAALRRLGLSNKVFGLMTGAHEVTVCRWAAEDGNGPPLWVGPFLKLFEMVPAAKRGVVAPRPK